MDEEYLGEGGKGWFIYLARGATLLDRILMTPPDSEITVGEKPDGTCAACVGNSDSGAYPPHCLMRGGGDQNIILYLNTAREYSYFQSKYFAPVSEALTQHGLENLDEVGALVLSRQTEIMTDPAFREPERTAQKLLMHLGNTIAGMVPGDSDADDDERYYSYFRLVVAVARAEGVEYTNVGEMFADLRRPHYAMTFGAGQSYFAELPRVATWADQIGELKSETYTVTVDSEEYRLKGYEIKVKAGLIKDAKALRAITDAAMPLP